MDWLTAAKPIRDELRKQQRSALVAHLLHTVRVIIPIFESPHPTLQIGANRPAVAELQIRLNAAGATPKLVVDGVYGPKTRAAVIAFQNANDINATSVVGASTWAALNQVRQRLRNSNDLYAHFLIDVEMEPCMLTSRIKQATNSVQLFVQRCLLNLEPEVELTSGRRRSNGRWMKNYRVWEANRKIFLYPENWIEPELRDDKSPFFVNLEHGLLQDEVNDATVEREYLKYLRDLDRVARLEICGLYRQWEVDRDILHVVARTLHDSASPLLSPLGRPAVLDAVGISRNRYRRRSPYSGGLESSCVSLLAYIHGEGSGESPERRLRGEAVAVLRDPSGLERISRRPLVTTAGF